MKKQYKTPLTTQRVTQLMMSLMGYSRLSGHADPQVKSAKAEPSLTEKEDEWGSIW